MQTKRLNAITAFLNSILGFSAHRNIAKKSCHNLGYLRSKLLISLSVFVFSFPALAMNGRTTYQAKIIKPDGYPLEASSVNFRFTVLDTVGSCVLYVEDYSAVNMSGGGGLISFALGNGNRSFPVSGTSLTFQNTFDNSVPMFNCQTPGTYNPGPSDTRKIVMQFNDGGGWQTLPAMTINTVPYAMYANKSNDSKTLNGKADTAFVENSTLAALNCNPATHAITFNGVSFSCIPVGSSSSGITSVTTSGTVLVTGGTASAPVISIKAVTMSQDGYLTSLDYAEFKAKLAASSTQIVNTLGYAPVSGAAVTTQINNSNLSGDVSGTISSNSVVSVGGKTASQISTSVNDTLAATSSNTASTIVKRDSSGNFTANDIYANAAKINYVDIYRPSSSFNVRLQASTSLSANYVLNLPTTSGTLGQVLSTDGSGNLSWINPSTGSVVSVSATAPLASTGGSNPTISITQANSTTNGYLSSTDWNTFNNKQAATSAAIIATLGYTPADNAASGTYLQKANNLSDLASVATARTNLGLGSLAVGNSIDLGSASATGIIADARLLNQSNVISGTQYTKVTVDGKGRVTSGATNLALSDLPASVLNTSSNFSGDISGVISNLIVQRIQGVSVTITSLTTNDILQYDGSKYANRNVPTCGSSQYLTFNGTNFSCVADAGASGTITTLSVTAPLSSTGGANPTISITQANSTTNGYLSSADWNAFNNKQAATSAAIIATLGYTPADNAASGTYLQKVSNLSDLTNIPQARTNLGLGGFATVSSLDLGTTSATGTLAIGRLPSFIGDATIAAASNTIVLSNSGVIAGTYSKVTVDVKGRVTSSSALSSSDVTTALGYTPANATSATQWTTNGSNIYYNTGNIGVGIINPSAKLELASGTSSTAPLKFTSGTLLTSAQSGTMEYDGFNFYLTDSTNTRRTIATGSGAGTIDNANNINSSGNITMTPVGSVIVSSTTASTNSNTGALVVKGGLGVSGNINTAGNLNVSGSSVIDGALKLSSMTSGSVLFADNNGVVAQDNNNFYWDNANKRLGIGSSSPAQTLSVSGISYFSGNVGVGTAGPNAAVDIFKSGTGSYTGLKSNISSTTGNATGVDVYANGSNYSTGVLVDTGSNGAAVGVDIYASVNSASGSYVRGINVGLNDSLVAGSGLRLFADTVTTKASKAIEISQGFNAGYAIYADTNGKSYFKGNVGIGTTNPRSHFDVSGSVTIGDLAANNASLTIYTRDSGSVSQGIVLIDRTAGYGSWQNPSGFDGISANSSGTVTGWGQLYLNYYSSGNIDFNYGGGHSLFRNRVAIGMGTTPTANLHIAAGTSSSAALKLISGTLLTSPQAGAVEYNGINFYITDGTNTRRVIAAGSSSGTIDNANNINSSGNITMTPVGSVIVSSTTASTNSNTGALVVKGGLGVSGNINTAGNLNVSGSSVIDGSLKLSSMTSGSVLFAGANGTVTQDNSNFYWDNTNKRLGVGTSAPAAKLEVSGSTLTDVAIIGSGAKKVYFAPDSQGIGLFSGAAQTGSGIYFNSLNNYASLFTSSTERVRVDSSGNVGIGTVTPNEKLDLSTGATYNTVNSSGVKLGNSNADSVDNGKSSYYVIKPGGNATGVRLDFIHNTRLSGTSFAGETSVMSLVNGNVGIGTTSPNGKLQIDTSTGTIGTYDNGDGALWTSYSVSKTIGLASSNENYGTGASYKLDGDGPLYHQWLVGGGSARMVMDSSGNIGIGTTTPSYKLEVNGTTIGARIATASSTVGSPQVDLFDSGRSVETVISSFDGTTAGTYIASYSNSPLMFGTNAASNPTNKMILTAAGNVGIGTTAPQTAFHVAKDITSQNAVSGSSLAWNGNSQIKISSGNNALAFAVIGTFNQRLGIIQAGHSGDGLNYYPDLTDPKLALQPYGGNVGIGTTTPKRTLHLAAGSPEMIFENTNQAVDAKNFRLLNRGAYFELGTVNDSVNADQKMIMSWERSSGNVGIGTTSPNKALTIVGAANTGIRVEGTSGNTHLDFTEGGAVKANFYWDLTNQRSMLNTTGSTLAINPSGGNVGIGITTPGSKLDIKGDNVNNTFRTTDTSGQFRARIDQFYDFYMTSASGTDTIVIKNSGNVGIGTNSPTGKFQVAGSHANGIMSDTNDRPSVGVTGGYPQMVLMAGGTTNTSHGSTIMLGSYDTGTSGNHKHWSIGTAGQGSTFLDIGYHAGTDINPHAGIRNYNGSTFMTILNSGNVGIGTTAPGYTLHVVGTAGLSTGTAWTNASDIRLKDIQGDYEYGLSEVLKLHTVRYNYKKGNALGLPSDFSKTGFIAQEVQKVIPDAVNVRKDGYLELNVDPIHWAVVNAVKDLYKLVVEIKNEILGEVRGLASVVESKADKAEIEVLLKDNVELKQKAAKLEVKSDKLEAENAALKSYLCSKDPAAPICK